MKTATSMVAALVLASFSAHAASAATAAYWRHEDGPAGSLIPDGPNTVLDSSGIGNHMQTFSSGFDPYTSATYSSNVSPLALRGGAANALSLDFGAGSDGVTPEGGEPNDDNYTNGKPINTQVFTALTVELAFNMKSIGGYQTLVGKDGKPIGDDPLVLDDSPVAPFAIKVRGDDFPDAVPNQLFVEWIDGDGTLLSDIHFLATRETVIPNQWYHVAVTLTSTEAQLWVAQQAGPYVLKDTVSGLDFTGAANEVLVQDPTPWSIGRGMFNNGVTDWSNAFIDEVRISDTALTPSQFLFVTAPGGNDADFNDDGAVDGRDFLIWQRSFGGPGTAQTGDATGDGQVTSADFDQFKAKFGGPPAVGAGHGVPEPASAALIALALGGVMRLRRQVAYV